MFSSLGIHHVGSMGTKYRSRGSYARVFTNSTKSSPARHRTQSSTPPPFGSSSDAPQGSYRMCPSLSKRSRFLFQVFPGKENRGEMAPDFRPAGAQHLSHQAVLPNVIVAGHSSPLEPERFHGNTGSTGCLFPRTHPSGSQTIPTIHSGQQPFPIYSSSFRTSFRSKDFHESFGPCRGLSQTAIPGSFSLSRRLAGEGTYLPIGHFHSDHLSPAVRATGPPSKFFKVCPASSEVSQVPQSASGHYFIQGSSFGSETVETDCSGSKSSKTTKDYCPQLQILPRFHLLLHSLDSLLQTPDASAPGATGPAVEAEDGFLQRHNIGHPSHEGSGRLVVSSVQSRTGTNFCNATCSSSDNNRRLSRGLGSCPSGPSDQWPVVPSRASSAHQCSRASSNSPSITGFPAKDCGFRSLGPDGQHDGHALREQAGRHTLSTSFSGSSGSLGMGNFSSSGPVCGAFTRRPQHRSRLIEPPKVCHSRVGVGSNCSGADILPLGDPDDRPIRNSLQQEMPVLRKQGIPSRVVGECPFDVLVRKFSVCVSPDTSHSKSPPETQDGALQNHSGSSVLGSPTLVHRAPSTIQSSSVPPAFHAFSPHEIRGSNSPSESRFALLDGLAPEHREFSHLDISQECRSVLAQARAPSTNKTYRAKWKRFCYWCRREGIHPFSSAPHQILPYILSLAKSGLAHSSLKVHIAAISRFRRAGSGPSLWSARIVKQFLKGLFRIYPPIRPPPPIWQLNLVLNQLIRPPFEPIHRSDLKFLSWKVALLLALTSARRVGELQALTIKEPYLQFKTDTVILRTNPTFIPKVPSEFHLNEPVILRSFFPKPSTPAERSLHTLDVQRCLKFYLQRTSGFRRSTQLFIAFSTPRKGLAITKQGISRWIANAIRYCHQAAGRPLQGRIRAHSTRSVSSSAALFAGVSIKDICRAATWSSVHSFTKHYCLEASDRGDAAVGQAVLRNLFN